MAVRPALEADKLLYALGPLGRYQILHLLMVSLGVFPTLIQLLDNVFIGGSVGHRCAQPNENRSSGNHEDSSSLLPSFSSSSSPTSNLSVTYEECHIQVKSNSVIEEYACLYGYEYEGPRTQSVVSQLDLVCDQEHLLRLTQTLVFAGQVIGAIVGPFCSDRFGRKPTMAIANLGMLVLGMAIAVAPNYPVFAISKFFMGSLQQSVYIPVCIYTGELLPTEHRRFSIIVNALAWCASGLSMSFVAYLMRDLSWRYLQAVLSLFSLGFIIQLWAMDESIVWLIANNKTDEAIKCVKRAAWWNNKEFEDVLKAGYTDEETVAIKSQKLNESPDDTISMLSEEKSHNDVSEEDVGSGSETEVKTEKLSFIQILRVRRLFINSVAMWATWFSASLSYFTLYLMVDSLAGDKYLNYILTSLMDIPACIIFYFGFNRYGRRSVTILLYAILATGTFTLGLLRHFTDTEHGVWSVLTIMMSLISVIGGGGCFFSIFFYLPELFPTNARNQATGYASCFARLAAMVSPFMGALAVTAVWAPGLVMCVFASIAICLLLLLPETKNKQLPQTLEDLEHWDKKDNFSSKHHSKDEKNSVA